MTTDQILAALAIGAAVVGLAAIEWGRRRLRCHVFGHARTETWADRWEHDREVGTYRVWVTRCSRCGGVLNIRSQLYPHETRP